MEVTRAECGLSSTVVVNVVYGCPYKEHKILTSHHAAVVFFTLYLSISHAMVVFWEFQYYSESTKHLAVEF